MMINLKQLKADRDAGTDGPWGVAYFAGIMDITAKYVHPVCDNVSSKPDARRISRLPELEATYIEVVAKLDKAVEALEEADDTLAKLSGSLAELDAALLAQEIAVIALERENIAPLITAKSERDE